MSIHGWICSTPVYQYDGWVFEMGYATCPWPLRKDLQPRLRAGRKFWEMIRKFDQLPEDEQIAYRIGGGCESF